MAISESLFLNGIKGTVGKQVVVKKYGDITIISKYPDMSNHKPTPSQKRVRGDFAQAMAYAKKALSDVHIKAAYKLKAQNMQRAINVAVKDFYNSPVVHNIDTKEFKGNIGDKIQIKASDDFRVFKVSITINDPNENLIEIGEAIELEEGLWEYSLQKNIHTQQIKIQATAYDLPGNTGQLAKEIII